MKKLSVFACISFFALASFTTESDNHGTSTKTEVTPADGVTGQITIVSVDQDGGSGVALTSSGVAVVFINPLHLPVSTGMKAVASITMDCPIIDPPTNPKDAKKKQPSSMSDVFDGPSTTSSSTTYGVAVIIAL